MKRGGGNPGEEGEQAYQQLHVKKINWYKNKAS